MQYGPKIVTNGLITHLDVADKKSYAGSGATIWRDLSGRNQHYDLYNSPTFANNFGGELRFDGVDDFARNSFDNINTLLQGSISIEMWIRSYTGTFGTNHNGRFVSIANEAGTGSSIGQGIDNDGTYFRITNQNAASYLELSGWTGTYCSESSATYINTDKYYQVVFTVNVSGGGVNQNYYLNGELKAGPLNWVRSPFSGNTTITLAMHSAGSFDAPLSNVKTAFAIFKFYSRVLSVAEIRQNFNANRARFGI